MRIELRGTLRAALGTSAIDLEVPAAGVPLSQLLTALAAVHPRAQRYLRPGPAEDALRIVVNGAVARREDDPRIHPQDAVLLMHAISGGGGDSLAGREPGELICVRIPLPLRRRAGQRRAGRSPGQA